MKRRDFIRGATLLGVHAAIRSYANADAPEAT